METNPQDPIAPLITFDANGNRKSQILNGLTKREYFAAQAINGIMLNPEFVNSDYKEMADQAVLMADALINALNHKK